MNANLHKPSAAANASRSDGIVIVIVIFFCIDCVGDFILILVVILVVILSLESETARFALVPSPTYPPCSLSRCAQTALHRRRP